MNNKQKAQAIHRMDQLIRMINDEENGVFEGWISVCVPDESSLEEIEEIVADDPAFYSECCEYFATHVTDMILNGDWTENGFTTELYNSMAPREAEKRKQREADNRQLPTFCPSCLNVDCVAHINLGDEYDSEGTFGKHRVFCTVCGRRSHDMDTRSDAIEAFEDHGDTVHFEGADTVLLQMNRVNDLIRAGVPLNTREFLDRDLRERAGV